MNEWQPCGRLKPDWFHLLVRAHSLEHCPGAVRSLGEQSNVVLTTFCLYLASRQNTILMSSQESPAAHPLLTG